MISKKHIIIGTIALNPKIGRAKTAIIADCTKSYVRYVIHMLNKDESRREYNRKWMASKRKKDLKYRMACAEKDRIAYHVRKAARATP